LTIHILAIALLLGVAFVLAFKVGFVGDQKPSSMPIPTISTAAKSERVVVMPIAGGQLEIATVRVRSLALRRLLDLALPAEAD
jgi:hypothetical protein